MSTAVVQRTDDDELRALARLAGEELGGAAGGIAQVHLAIADRAFRSPGAAPARALHDGIAALAYGGVRLGARAAGWGAGAALAGRGRALSASPRGGAVVATLVGLIGDRLERDGSPLAEPLAIRVDGRVVPPTAEALHATFPGATPRVVVFVHGLMETERSWALGGREPYGERLRRELGFTPVMLRVNTGRRISENGAAMADLLQDLVATWPVDIERLALVGHSMGGLIARSAAHQATLRGMSWPRLVRHVVSLGSPHAGAPLERAVHLLAAGLHRLPETRPAANFLRRRSGGIRDLHGGALVDEDWHDRDPEELRRAAATEVPLLEGAAHHFVSAELRPPWGRVLGDLLVLETSAAGRTIGLRREDGLHLRGAGHFALLNHPEVGAALQRWLSN